MKKVKTSDITTAIGMPIKSGTIDHLQSAYTDTFVSLVKNLIGKEYDANKVYILEGLENTGTGNTYTISAGSVFFSNEIFQVDAFTGTAASSSIVPMVSVTTTYFSDATADPVTFTDGVPRNVHEIRKATLTLQTVTIPTANLSYLNFVPLQTRAKVFSAAAGNLPAGIVYGGTASGTVSFISLYVTKLQDLCLVNYAIGVNITTAPANSDRQAVIPLTGLGLPFPNGIVTIGGTTFYGNYNIGHVSNAGGGAQGTGTIATIVSDLGDPTLNYTLMVNYTAIAATGVRTITGQFFYRCDTL